MALINGFLGFIVVGEGARVEVYFLYVTTIMFVTSRFICKKEHFLTSSCF